MTQDLIRYDLLAQEALRGLVRKVLVDTAKYGLPGEHHFFITFDVTQAGVKIPNRLREKFPETMTIALQHQFRDLQVTDTAFEVGLSFGGIPERLRVPFSAIKEFVDPSVKFGLQFETMDVSETAELADVPVTPPAAPVAPVESEAKTEDSSEDSRPESGAQVLKLDQFRKK